MLFSRPESRPGDIEESQALVDDVSFDDSHEFDELDEKRHIQSRRRFDMLFDWLRAIGAKRLPFSLIVLFRMVPTCVGSLLIFLLPSFITNLLRRKLRSTPEPSQPRIISPTAYLDGLRGVAALVVYVFHLGYLWFPFLRHGHGALHSEDLFLQLPVVRVLHSGRASVTLFFVISGYVISARTLSLIYLQHHRGGAQQQAEGRVLESLAGSLFRRPLRLYLPVVASTLVILVLLRFDVLIKDPTKGAALPPRKDGLGQQLWHWLAHMLFMINPFRPITGRANLYSPPYNGHLWTIPVEFKGSVTVFVLLLAFARARRCVHLAAAAAAAALCCLVQMGDCDQALFCAGMILAELALRFPPVSEKSVVEIPCCTRPLSLFGAKTRRRCRHILTIILFVSGLHLLSYPEERCPKMPGYRTISRLVPPFYAKKEENTQLFWMSVGSVLFILALMYSLPYNSESYVKPAEEPLPHHQAAMRAPD
ncbi:Uu.00g059230.m01.CDS01, partial [Anthostomella pinea]